MDDSLHQGQTTLPSLASLLSADRLHEQIRAWLHTKTKLNWEPYVRLTYIEIEIVPRQNKPKSPDEKKTSIVTKLSH